MITRQLQLAAAIALLGLAATVAADVECGSSVMFGAPWQPNNPYYIQEAAWKTHGLITKLNLYYNPDSGCLLGVKPTYGDSAANARRLGIEKLADGRQLQQVELNFEDGEYITKADFKFGRCITYLSLHTNTGRNVAVGDPQANGPLQTSVPDSDDGYLAYFKGYTSEPMSSDKYGKLQQLQLIWGARVCTPTMPSTVPAAKPKQQQQQQARNASVKRTMSPAAAASDQQQQPVVEEVQEDVVTDVTSAPAAAPVPAATVTNSPADVTNSQTDASDSSADVTYEEVTETDVTAVDEATVISTEEPASAPPVAVTELVTETPVPAPAVQPAAAAATPAAAAAGTQVTTKSVTDLPKCAGPTCSDGTCPTASCALNGMGKDVVTMKCFGTNIVPAPMLDLNVQNACTNLACKLDRPNCTSTGVLGIGGFCTGRVVAMGTTAKLHPSGQAFLGYPCMESRGLISEMVPVIGDYTAKGTYVAKAWKVCDCINGFGLADNSVAFRTYKGGSITIQPPKFPTLPHFPFVNRALINMSMPDVLAQWVVANQNQAQVPKVFVDAGASDNLRELLVNFTIPAILVPKISQPLFKIPKGFQLPVFTIPIGNRTLTRVTDVLPDLTSLPTIVAPKWKMPSFKLPKLQVPEVTISNLDELAQDWGVPTMPKLPPLFRMNISDVAAQWQAANEFDLPVPKITLPDFKIGTLKNIIPNFRVPSMVIANISVPLLHLPSPFSMPVYTLPSDNDTLQAISELIPKINSLPQIMVHDSKAKVPELSLPNVTVPDFGAVVDTLGAVLPRPRMPTFSGLNFSLANLPNLLPPIHRLDFPKMPSTINISTPSFTIPDLSSMVTAVSNLPDLRLDWSQFPKVLDAWKDKYMDNPAAFDWSSFMDMMRTNPVVGRMVDGFEVSFEVPDFLAHWVASIAKKSPLPKFNVASGVLKQLKKIVPGIPDTPSLIVVNITSPYLKTEEPVANLPTVVIPDDVVPQVTHLLPNFTNIPSLLVPDGNTIELNITLPDITKSDLLNQLTAAAPAGDTTAAAGPTVTVDTPAAAAPAAAPAAAAPEETPMDTSDDDDEDNTDQSSVTPSDGPAAAAAAPAPAQPVVVEAPAAEPVVVEAPPTAVPAAPAAAAAAAAVPAGDAGAPVPVSDSPVTVTEVPAEAITSAGGTFAQVTAAATARPPQAQRLAKPQPDSKKPQAQKAQPQKPQVTQAQKTQTQKTQTQKPESQTQPEESLESAMVMDDEGAMILSKGMPGIETAFMDPKQFYALDKNTQKAMKAMFAV